MRERFFAREFFPDFLLRIVSRLRRRSIASAQKNEREKQSRAA
jgi:hypothetical protein